MREPGGEDRFQNCRSGCYQNGCAWGGGDSGFLLGCLGEGVVHMRWVSRCWDLRLVELELSGNSTCFPFPPLGLEPSAEERTVTVTASLQTLGPGE